MYSNCHNTTLLSTVAVILLSLPIVILDCFRFPHFEAL